MMKWWLGRPDGVAQWTGSSFASAVTLVGTWCVAAVVLWLSLSEQAESTKLTTVLLTLAYPVAVGTHGLLWWQVVRGVWALYRDAAAGPAWPLVIAVLWWVALLVFQWLCLLGWQAASTPAAPGGTPLLQF
jgi:hypothetical protein